VRRVLRRELREAAPVAKLIAEDGQTVTGWVYQWNTDELTILWMRHQVRTRFIYPALNPKLAAKAKSVTNKKTYELLMSLQPG
jgi:hypothetical protein